MVRWKYKVKIHTCKIELLRSCQQILMRAESWQFVFLKSNFSPLGLFGKCQYASLIFQGFAAPIISEDSVSMPVWSYMGPDSLRPVAACQGLKGKEFIIKPVQ